MVWSDNGDTSDFSEYSNIGSDVQITPNKSEKKYACTYIGCNLVFSRPYRLSAHIYTHTGEKPYLCTWSGCKKAYTNKSHLTRHIKSVHKRIILTSSQKCEHCSQVFSTSQNLRKHISRIHESKYPYYCTICNIGFMKKNVLAQHMFYHTGNDPFRCHLCDKTFSELMPFNKHKRNHKVFECFCKETFTRWSDMMKHKKVHLQTEFICDTCQKVFKSRIDIVRHIRCHSTNKLVYQCTYDGCPKFYSSKYNLVFHIKSYHENLTFNCTVEGCNAKLSTKAKLKFHISKHSSVKLQCKGKDVKHPHERKQRKDMGLFKRSTAVKLIGIQLPPVNEMKLVYEASINEETSASF